MFLFTPPPVEIPSRETGRLPKIYEVAGGETCSEFIACSFEIIPGPEHRVVSLSELCDDKACIKLSRPVEVSLANENGDYLAENEELKIYVAGSSLLGALHEFQVQMIGSWEGLKLEPAGSLTPGASALRDKLESYIVG